ncbi:unnamed protein product [Urochloa humidicola]
MEQYQIPLYYYCSFTLFLALLFHVIFLRAKSSAAANKPPALKLPPGPWRLPVIGSIHHLLNGLPHHTMRDLSRFHGPVMLLKICELTVFVVTSADAAREVFKRPGTAFEQRPSSPGLDELHAGVGLGVALAPYGEHWRFLRRVLVAELLGARRVETAFQHIRHDEAAQLALAVAGSLAGEPVHVSELLGRFIADSSVRAILGDRLPDRDGFLRMMRNATDLSSNFDLRDLFPSSRLVRMLPRSGKARRHLMEVFRLFDDILRRHEERRVARDGDAESDMVNVLLRLQKEEGMGGTLTPGVIKSMVMDVFGAAVDTQVITLQWAMAELAANPRVMEKAQREIRHVLAGRRSVQEDGQKIQGYDVPKGTILVTNAWAISRDPKYWDDPDSFVPERFEGVKEEDIDMTEVFGVTVKRKADLLLHAIPRVPVVYE